MQVAQPQGFTALNGSGLGVVEGLLNLGEGALDNPDGFLTPCPVGSRVDGYQVVTGALIYQIRPRCSCFNCGTEPSPAAAFTLWSFLCCCCGDKQGLWGVSSLCTQIMGLDNAGSQLHAGKRSVHEGRKLV